MAARFLEFDGLIDRLEGLSFDRAPAIVCNAHITGLGVSRALARHDVPVIAVDRTGDGVAPPSSAVTVAGRITYPLSDLEGFREDCEAIADAIEHDPVAFGCMDEWVHAFAETRPDGVRLPFAERDVVDSVLDKESLYGIAEELDVPYPETCRIADTGDDEAPAVAANVGDPVDAGTAADELGFPLVVKPALKREFEEAVGTNVIEVADREEYEEVIERARGAGIRLMAQEKVPLAEGEDCSLASYVPPTGEATTFVGNPLVRYPRAFGTSCVVERVDRPEVEQRALSVLEETGYYGISEAEFVYDTDREEYVLLDVNTRPWKWIGLPVAAGANLPMAAYADAIGADYDPAEPADSAERSSAGRPEAIASGDARWVYLPDYLELLATDETFGDVLSETEWAALVSGAFEDDASLATGVYSPSDPAPTYQVIQTEFGGREYYCSC